MVVSSPRCGENTIFFSSFPLGWIHSWGVFFVIPLEFQGKKHQPFSRTQPILLVIYREPQEINQQSFAVTPHYKTPSPWEASPGNLRQRTGCQDATTVTRPIYKSLWRGKGEAWRGEGETFSRKFPRPLQASPPPSKTFPPYRMALLEYAVVSSPQCDEK